MREKVFKITISDSKRDPTYISATSLMRAISACCDKHKMKTCKMLPWDAVSVNALQTMRLNDGERNYFLVEILDSDFIERLQRKGKIKEASAWTRSRS